MWRGSGDRDVGSALSVCACAGHDEQNKTFAEMRTARRGGLKQTVTRIRFQTARDGKKEKKGKKKEKRKKREISVAGLICGQKVLRAIYGGNYQFLCIFAVLIRFYSFVFSLIDINIPIRSFVRL